ncbi:hypothetical protein [Streptomyces sp. 11x1]|uniref:hypothetical protein n=1 Tax=Streptomyces sp. 11x1 TaxID=3038642 RepID=UPI0037D9B722
MADFPQPHHVPVGGGKRARVLEHLGYVPAIVFEKRCRSHAFEAYGRPMLATLVRVPELDGTFLEVETLVEEEAEVGAALDDIRAVLEELGVSPEELTRELYTDAVAAARRTAEPGTGTNTGSGPGFGTSTWGPESLSDSGPQAFSSGDRI